ncbi:MAG: PmoA family protein [Planctomycetia bacterium]|nr:PmoA family protein [Planctomycetia bacterium]
MYRYWMVLGLFWTVGLVCGEEVRLETSDDMVNVYLDDACFTTYRFRDGQNPIFWPIVGPDGERMTRDYPMQEGTENESLDHPHHRSLWFTHGEINGVNFWHTSDKAGRVIHESFTKTEPPVLEEKNRWVDAEGKVLFTETRTMTFGADATGRWIDFVIAIHASHGDVTFADTKEGTFGLRVPGTLDVTRKMGGKIVNSDGLENDAAWGKRAAWVDYHGELHGKKIGIAIMNHPQSAFYPTYWHVRTYGLFAANPFGVRDFTGDKNLSGEFRLPAGETLTLKYRVYFHTGDEKTGHVAENFESYSRE